MFIFMYLSLCGYICGDVCVYLYYVHLYIHVCVCVHVSPSYCFCLELYVYLHPIVSVSKNPNSAQIPALTVVTTGLTASVLCCAERSGSFCRLLFLSV